MPLQACYWTSVIEPPLISGIVFVVRNFNHSYQMPPLYCLVTSGFLSCSCIGWGHCTSKGSCYSLVFIGITWGSCVLQQVCPDRGAIPKGNSGLDLCQMNSLTSPVCFLWTTQSVPCSILGACTNLVSAIVLMLGCAPGALAN